MSEEEIRADTASSLALIAAGTLYAAGLVDLDWEADGGYRLRPLDVEDRPARGGVRPAPLPLAGVRQTLTGDGAPISWVMTGPSPYDGIKIVCAPDSLAEVGIRCKAEWRTVGGETEKLNILFMDDEAKEDYDEWITMLEQER
jgi:hypothetical protein